MDDEEMLSGMATHFSGGYGFLGHSSSDDEPAADADSKRVAVDELDIGDSAPLTLSGSLIKILRSRATDAWERPRPGALLWANWVLYRASNADGLSPAAVARNLTATDSTDDTDPLAWEEAARGESSPDRSWRTESQARLALVAAVERARATEASLPEGLLVLDAGLLRTLGGALLHVGLDSMVAGECATFVGAAGLGPDANDSGDLLWRADVELVASVDVVRVGMHALDPTRATKDALAWGQPHLWTETLPSSVSDAALKYVFEPAESFVSPVPGQSVRVAVDGESTQFAISDGSREDDLVEYTVCTMRLGEACIAVQSDGDGGLTCVAIRLSDVDRGTPNHELCPQCKLDALQTAKTVGNTYFNAQRFRRAMQVYEAAQWLFASSDAESMDAPARAARARLEAACYTNAAMLHFRAGAHRPAISAATRALDIRRKIRAPPDAVTPAVLIKARLVRARAALCIQDHDAAIADCEAVLELDPGHAAAAALAKRTRRRRKAHRAATATLYARMASAPASTP
ncbi:uncharacterized protein AMSG_00320 [Thecamonas trahens ATCC 50062]|uniref:peptidylprolyl isomerase n=1 Tax=Thecamonas trahens ATCC 50062 TaxID=461836 RepID=A0A0L0D1W9_THETB|nr:hypothetical protein AMSG_00320 [Thecamonas trahens ATCC 50062]KNC46201.1 hypothetical protein AMSG_00320 [Thecamonas trahens ATCC 50062]|eukprot:XP_013763176.1 hypothetical protein AMSG_00320 [Thecamonas trahens ATCC 50062]